MGLGAVRGVEPVDPVVCLCRSHPAIMGEKKNRPAGPTYYGSTGTQSSTYLLSSEPPSSQTTRPRFRYRPCPSTRSNRYRYELSMPRVKAFGGYCMHVMYCNDGDFKAVTGWLAATNVKVGNSKRLRLGKQLPVTRITAAGDLRRGGIASCCQTWLAAFNQVRLATATHATPAQPAQRDKKLFLLGPATK